MRVVDPRPWLVALLLAGCGDVRLLPTDTCDGADNDGDGVVDLPDDADGDGFPPCEAVGVPLDCDDVDPTVFPGAAERCDGRDDDCDGQVPSGEADTDGDGLRACAGDCDDGDPAANADDADLDGWTTCAGDCDDADATRSPAAAERCDGVDQDCDGLLSAEEADADGDGQRGCDGDCDDFDAAVYDADLDGDGYSPCDGAWDCDDTDAAVNPAGVEVCDEVDQDCDGEVDEDAADAPTWYADTDGDGFGDAQVTSFRCDAPDGYTDDATDCDDGVATTFPGADETCDDADDDCDGVVDEDDALDAPTWYADADADGYGDAAGTHISCDAPPGYDDDPLDCDDTRADVSPEDAEVCDGVDDDCDGTVDEADAVDAPTWYADADGDMYGDPGTSTPACTAPAGHVADGSDCDDADATVSPAGTEVCNDVDDDCDGTIDGAGATGGATWSRDADGDGYGDPSVTTSACDAPSGYVADDTDCDDADADVHPGAAEAPEDGVDADCDGDTTDGRLDLSIDDADAIVLGTGTSQMVGSDLAGIPGYRGAGSLGFALSSGGADEGGTNDGAVFLFYTLPAGTVDTSAADAVFSGDVDEQAVGAAAVGDCDGDGYADLVAGASGDDTLAFDAGALFLAAGASSPASSRSPSSSGVTSFWGDGVFEFTGGEVVSGADVDGDGLDDVAAGAQGRGSGGTVWVLYGVDTGADATLSGLADEIAGEGSGDALGGAMALLPDVDGDGYDELALATGNADRSATDAGAAYVFLGGAAGLGSGSVGRADVILEGEAASDRFGRDFAGPADLDADGTDDVVIGAYDARGGVGAAYVVPVPALVAGAVDVGTVATHVVSGVSADDHAGIAVATGDLDADGAPDLALGAPGADGGGVDFGAVFVLYGPLVGDPTTDAADLAVYGRDGDATAGDAVDMPGDLDGDGADELLVGVPDDSTGALWAGAAHMFRGTP